MATNKQHTPGPWKVMPCPQHHGKHPFHDHRWIATADAVVEFGHDPRSWGVENGSLICEMRDGPSANARLIAAAPDLLLVAVMAKAYMEQRKFGHGIEDPLWHAAKDAIAKVEGRA